MKAVTHQQSVVSIVIPLLFALCVQAEAQQPASFKVGELVFGDEQSRLGEGRQLFRHELRNLGYVEGKNIVFEIGRPRVSWTDSLNLLPSWFSSTLMSS
jgi:hypothetical protein